MKKILFIALALVLALGGLGVGYAAWTDQVNVNGSVNTGKVCIKFQVGNQTDRACPSGNPWYVGPGNGDPNLDLSVYPPSIPTQPDYVYTEKNVACTNIQGVHTNTLLVTVNNAYPLYYNDLEIEFCNCGTVPVKLQSIYITPLNFVNAPYAWDEVSDPGNTAPLWVRVTDGIGTQLEQGQCKSASVKFVVQEAALQNAGRGLAGDPPAYQFTITWTVIQWNEYENGTSGPGVGP